MLRAGCLLLKFACQAVAGDTRCRCMLMVGVAPSCLGIPVPKLRGRAKTTICFLISLAFSSVVSQDVKVGLPIHDSYIISHLCAPHTLRDLDNHACLLDTVHPGPRCVCRAGRSSHPKPIYELSCIEEQSSLSRCKLGSTRKQTHTAEQESKKQCGQPVFQRGVGDTKVSRIQWSWYLQWRRSSQRLRGRRRMEAARIRR